MRVWRTLLAALIISLGVLTLQPVIPVGHDYSFVLADNYSTCYGAINPTGDPQGGGDNYSDIIISGDYECDTVSEFLVALAAADAGDIIFIPGTATIDLSNYYEVEIPGGVTVASNRGYGGSEGGIIKHTKMSSWFDHMLEIKGNYVRFNGLRFEGPDGSIGTTGAAPLIDAIYSYGYKGLEVENCEFYNWTYAGIAYYGDGVGGYNNAGRAYVHHNDFHHNRRQGLGYGIQTSLSSVLLEANTFDYGRHYHAGERTINYVEARYNIFGPNCTNTLFDQHGGNDNSCMGLSGGPNPSLPAGGLLYIHHNTFQSSSQPSVGLRGVPYYHAYINNNWSYGVSNHSWSACGSYYSGVGMFYQQVDRLGLTPPQNMTVSNNWYGTEPPADCGYEVEPPDEPYVPPVVPAPNPILIYDLDDLQAVNDNLSADYALANDIDASATATWHQGAGFIPLTDFGYFYAKPTSDNTVTGTWPVYPASPTTRWDKVDESYGGDSYNTDNDSTYIDCVTTGDSILFGYTPPDLSWLPAAGSISSVTVVIVARDVVYGTNSITGRIVVGGTTYTGYNTTTTSYYQDKEAIFVNNPKTGVEWTVEDVEGTSANPLQLFGIYSADADPDIRITCCYLKISCYFDEAGPYGSTIFTGSFDGRGHTITGLHMDRPEEYEAGLFGLTENATFTNIHFEDCDLTLQTNSAILTGYTYSSTFDGITFTNCTLTSYGQCVGMLIGFSWPNDAEVPIYVSNCHVYGGAVTGAVAEAGALIGWAGISIIQDCSSSATVGSLDSGDMVGGLVGWFDGGLMENCYATGDVTALEDAGGLVGWAWWDEEDGHSLQYCIIRDCYATGDVTADSYAGGFIGWAGLDGAGDVEIERCYSTGDVIAFDGYSNHGYLGGFVGWHDYGIIEQCYSTGDVIAAESNWIATGYGAFAGCVDTDDPEIGEILDCYARGDVTITYDPLDPGAAGVGGFVGEMYGAYLTNCYSTGNVTCANVLPAYEDYVGGFLGKDWNDGVATDCYWDNQTSGWSTSDGGELVIGLTTADATTQESYPYWDFEDVWCMPASGVNDGYPILRDNPPPGGACAGCALPDAMFETYKEVSQSNRPMWYQALPSILKLLYVGFILMSAIAVWRQKPRDEREAYPNYHGYDME